MLRIQRLSLVLLVLPAAGCAQGFKSVEDAHAQGEGTSRTYAVPVHEVYEAARAVLRCEGASYVGDGEGGGELLASWEPAIGSFLSAYPGLEVVAVPNSRTLGAPEQFAFPMSMGVREGDDAFKQRLDDIIQKHQAELTAILAENGVRLYTPGQPVP